MMGCSAKVSVDCNTVKYDLAVALSEDSSTSMITLVVMCFVWGVLVFESMLTGRVQ